MQKVKNRSRRFLILKRHKKGYSYVWSPHRGSPKMLHFSYSDLSRWFLHLNSQPAKSNWHPTYQTKHPCFIIATCPGSWQNHTENIQGNNIFPCCWQRTKLLPDFWRRTGKHLTILEENDISFGNSTFMNLSKRWANMDNHVCTGFFTAVFFNSQKSGKGKCTSKGIWLKYASEIWNSQ